MQKYQEPFLTQTGDAAGYVSVLVQEYPGLATATIYSDDGVTPKANPMTTDGLGNAPFYAANGRYQLTISGSKVVTTTKTDIQLFDPADGAASSDIGYMPAGTGAVATTVQTKLRESVSVFDFMTAAQIADVKAGTLTLDVTAAIQAAIDYAESVRSTDVVFLPGNYRIDGTLTSGGGIRLIGFGAMGAQTAMGTCFTHTANAVNMLVWDGNHASSNSGVGGGVFNIQCVKGAGYSGGDAIKLLATSDDYRPGEFTIENVLVWAGSGGNWARGLHVDGTAANTPGSKGVRSIKIDKLRVGDCSTNNEYVYLNQAVHVVSEYLQIETAGGTGTCGMTVTGDSDNLILSGLIVNGNLIIGGSSAMNVTLNGRVSTLDVNNSLVQGAASIQSTAITSAASNFTISSNITDDFLVTVASDILNVTGDGTSYPIVFDTEKYDKSGAFSAGTFTAKQSGRYLFSWCVGYTGLLNTHTRQDTGIIHRRGGGTIIDCAAVSNPYAQGANSGSNYSEKGSIEIEVLEGDTVVLNANVSGGTKVVDIQGAATVYTWFSGKYLA